MNKKRGIIIAVILFLFLGTSTFVFANPSEDKIEGTGTMDGEREQDEDTNANSSDSNYRITNTPEMNIEDGTLNTNENQPIQNRANVQTNGANRVPTQAPNNNVTVPNTNDNNITNNGNNNQDNNNTNTPGNNENEESKIKAAEEAVQKAEQNITQENIDKAKELVTALKDSTKKQELLNRLNKIQETLNENNKVKAAEEAVQKAEQNITQENIDKAKELVNTLKDSTKKQELLDKVNELQNNLDTKNLVITLSNMVTNAKNKKNINDAIQYRETNEIVKKVNSLKDNELKQELLKTLTELSKIIDDLTPPIISGVNNNDYINRPVSIEINDSNDFKIYLNGKEVNINEIKNITIDNNYNLVVIDKAFNKSELNFTIDTISPILSGVEQNKIYNEPVKIEVTNEKEEVITYLTKDGVNIEYKLGTELTENGNYTIYVEDKAKNKSEVISFTINNFDSDAFVFEDLTFFNTSHISVKNTEYSWMKISSPYETTDFIKEYTVTYSTVYKIELFDKDKKYIKTVNMIYDKSESRILKNSVRLVNNGVKLWLT